MDPILFDSSVYITELRRGEEAFLSLRQREVSNPVWLSSVVLEELYAGAGPKVVEIVERLEREFERASRILVPDLLDWTNTGKVLALLAAKYGYETVGCSRLTNDALIAIGAGRIGIKVITSNARDFARLAEFSSFTWSIL